MGALSSSSSALILRNILLRRPPPPLSATHISTFTHILSYSIFPVRQNSIMGQTSSISPFISITPISHVPRCLSTVVENIESLNDTPENVDETPENIDDTETEIPSENEMRIRNQHKEMMSKLKEISGKEKKELGSYANSLGKKLKSQQIGKSGVTDAVAIALVETLEANELLKLKIHSNCPGELDDVVSQLEEATGSVVVGRIGRTIILYRPSLTKLKAEEKKKQALKVFLKRRAAYKASYQGKMQSRGQPSTQSNRKPYRRSR
uniref:uncharacterized protein LOC122606968 n=1 Tax=Erigeron canadensis TaxID=72917 RepID=UPI001CB97927|nr:uncharacterized protein LOC122606968 [Erigeron canadensis]